MEKSQSNLAVSKYKETMEQLLSMIKKNPDLKASDFFSSVSVNASGFKDWMSSHGYGHTFEEIRKWARKHLREQFQTKNNVQEIDKHYLIDDKHNHLANNPNAKGAKRTQYWWLNLNSETWDVSTSNIGEEKAISLFADKKSTSEILNSLFSSWLSTYLINWKENPHFGWPIAQRELAISLLDYCGIIPEHKSIAVAYKCINKNLLVNIRTSNFVVNPDVVLRTDTDITNGYRQCSAWQYPKSRDGSIPTDNEGCRLPRVLKTSKKVYYFYPKNSIPKHPYDDEHEGDPNYVQKAPQKDPEIEHPNILAIRPSSQEISQAKEGDLVYVCSIESKHIIAKLEITSVVGAKVYFKIVDILKKPCPINSFEEPYINFYEDENVSMFRIKNADDLNETIKKFKPYTIEDIIKEVYIEKETIQNIQSGLEDKKNIILQGAPGVGKTFLAKKLAYALIGQECDSLIRTIQFHPNYTYEDFVIGYKPNENGNFKLKPGVFKTFCDEALKKPKKKFCFIIDEINRGNLSKIFGEAFTLIEKDYRGKSIDLAYANETLTIPENVYIIGIMNTADRSLSMIDAALRRRFKFFTLNPAFDIPKFETDQKKLKNKQFDNVISAVLDLNKIIEKDPALGNGFRIGHSYFCNKDGLNPNGVKSVIKDEIIPLLKEYWFDDDDSVFESKIKELRETLKIQNDNE